MPGHVLASVLAILIALPVAAHADGAPGPTERRLLVSIEAGPQAFVGDCYACGIGDRFEAHVRAALGLRLAGDRHDALYLIVPLDVSEVMNGGPIQGNETRFDYRTISVTPGLEARVAITRTTALAFEAGYGTWDTDIPCSEDCDGYLVNGPHGVIRLGAGVRHTLSQHLDLTADADWQIVRLASSSRSYGGVFVGASYAFGGP